MNIKLIALDMDGTVLRTDKTISDRNIEVIRKAAEKDILIVPATGRMAGMIPKQILDLGCVRYALTSNGASVVDLEKNKVVYSNLMTKQETEYIINFLSQYNILFECFAEGKSYSDLKFKDKIKDFADYPQIFKDMIMNSQNFVENIPDYMKSNDLRLEKINIPYMTEELNRELNEKLGKMKEFAITSSFLNNIEINRVSSNKGDGLSNLCKYLNIDAENVMACGDQLNDLQMLKIAGCSVAMGNGADEVKKVAKFETLTNDEDGVAYAIEKYVD